MRPGMECSVEKYPFKEPELLLRRSRLGHPGNLTLDPGRVDFRTGFVDHDHASVLAAVIEVQKSLQLSSGPGMVYVVNADVSPHTFDIELNGRVLSYPAPGHSTTAVVPDLTAPGNYTYWCAIPGHRPSMEGTLEVTQ